MAAKSVKNEENKNMKSEQLRLVFSKSAARRGMVYLF
jgi:hypothetical protein